MLKMEYGCNWGRLCESCRVSASTLYCHTDSAYLCCSCDERIHVMGSPCWPHHRVRICGACVNAPAAFTCKADDASLCINCDFEIHSANPIASRHNRAPVSPLSQVINDTVTTTTETNNNDNDNNVNNHDVVENNNNNNKEMDEREADSWLLLDSEAIESQVVDDGFMFGEAEDHHHQHHYDGGHVGCGLECDSTAKFQNFQEHHHDQQTYSFSEDRMNESDSVVPVQSVESQPQQQQQHQQQQQQQQNMYFNMEHDPSKMAFTNYPPNRPTVGVSYMEGHVNYRFSRDESYVWKCPNSSNANAIGEMNRKAGVEKYREKKKSRKFEKRIRYAYRKAYAEKRPRVKGRFAKRQDLASSHSQQPPHQLPSSHLIN